jgi:hypothetical protein
MTIPGFTAASSLGKSTLPAIRFAEFSSAVLAYSAGAYDQRPPSSPAPVGNGWVLGRSYRGNGRNLGRDYGW